MNHIDVRMKMRSEAFDRGHSSGLRSIYDAMSDLCELVEFAYKLGKEGK